MLIWNIMYATLCYVMMCLSLDVANAYGLYKLSMNQVGNDVSVILHARRCLSLRDKVYVDSTCSKLGIDVTANLNHTSRFL